MLKIKKIAFLVIMGFIFTVSSQETYKSKVPSGEAVHKAFFSEEKLEELEINQWLSKECIMCNKEIVKQSLFIKHYYKEHNLKITIHHDQSCLWSNCTFKTKAQVNKLNANIRNHMILCENRNQEEKLVQPVDRIEQEAQKNDEIIRKRIQSLSSNSVICPK